MMTANESNQNTEPRLGRTLKGDIKTGVIWSTMRRDFDELKTFYIDDEKKLRLVKMRWYKRWFFLTLWLLKSLLLKLTPTRRILLFLGLILGFGVIQIGNGENIVVWSPLGEILVLFVLMLELKDKLIARDELEAGRKIQHALMPPRSPEVEGWSLWLYTRPANEVGGDLVDFLSFGKNRRAAVLADVSGKGLQAALLTAKLQASIRALAQDHQSVSKLARKVNEIFHRDTPPNMFASLLYVEFSPNSGRIKYVNAGHLPPLLLKPDGVHEMAKGELALGLIKGSSYTEQTLRLQSGDVFLAYSDGLSEAKNKQGEFFGVDRFLRLLPTLRDLPADALAQSITEEIDRFVGDARANDDLSLIILKRS